MQTPYDSALRVQRRAIDAVRLSLIGELAREHAVGAERSALQTRMARERLVAASNWQVCAHPFIRQQDRVRNRLDADQRSIEASLGRLRDAAMEACGQMQACSGAAETFVADRLHREASAEQAEADDFAGARAVAGRRQHALAGR